MMCCSFSHVAHPELCDPRISSRYYDVQNYLYDGELNITRVQGLSYHYPPNPTSLLEVHHRYHPNCYLYSSLPHPHTLLPAKPFWIEGLTSLFTRLFWTKGTMVAGLAFDMMDTTLINVVGRRHTILFPPSATQLLYPSNEEFCSQLQRQLQDELATGK